MQRPEYCSCFKD